MPQAWPCWPAKHAGSGVEPSVEASCLTLSPSGKWVFALMAKCTFHVFLNLGLTGAVSVN